MSLSKPCTKKIENVYRRHFSDKKKYIFLECLERKLKNFDINKGDPNELLSELVRLTKEAIDSVFPLQKVSNKQALKISNPWMTNELIKQHKIRDRLKSKWIKSGHINNSAEHSAYKKMRNQVTKMDRKAKRKYFNNKCDEANGNSEKMWKVIRSATNQKPKPNISPDFVKIRDADGKIVKKLEDKCDIANEMNKTFSEMGAKLAEKLEPTDSLFSDYLQYPNPNHERFILGMIAESEVGKLMQELDENKSVGLDDIPPKIVKWADFLFCPLLTKIFNKCVLGGIYPDCLKTARVRPIFKGGNKNDTSNYRPISILSQFNRIFEKLLRDRLYDFVKDKLYTKQFGFRPKNSTEHPVLDLKENVFENCNKKLISCILFLDLKKAFDSVSHKILLSKLEYYGVKGVALKLFKSYLSNRKQLTAIGEFVSVLELIEWGVPQGSVLGPLLFLIFINDIPNASELLTWLFADDTALMASAQSLSLLQTVMNREVAKVQTWLLANKLSVHYVKKSQFMLINKNNKTRIDDKFELTMGGHIISRTKSYKYLGITVDEKFSWADHINDVCSKLSQVAGIMFKIRHLVSKKALMLIYHSLAGSKLRYGLICWATAYQYLLDKVDVAHNNIITCMTFKKRCSEMWPLFCQLKVLPLSILIKIEKAKTMYKYRNNMLPAVFETYFEKPSHQHKTRFSKNNLAQVHMNSAKDKSLLKYIGPKIWKSIPCNIKDAASIKVFIKSYRTHLIGNYPFNDNDDINNNSNSIYYYY